MINSYPSIYNLGHSAVAELLHEDVIVEEKVDGSQFSFLKTEEGEIECRSKGAVINTIAPEGMFKLGVDMALGMKEQLPTGVTFRGEYLAKPKHNVLCYSRVPKNNVILFDINTGLETYMGPKEKRVLAESLGFEMVPSIFEGRIDDPSVVRGFLERESVLGGQKIEGVVIKPKSYGLYGRDKKVLMGKFVSEAFKEVHARDWKKENGPKSSNDILRELALMFASPARWQKALIHLQEEGKITGELKDIQHLMAAVPPDVLKECEIEIKDMLFKWAWPNLKRSVTRGLPEWYKGVLLSKQFES